MSNKRTIPNNLKQIGSMVENPAKVFIEDYAYTFLNQYAGISQKEKLAFLIGESFLNENNENIILISGSIACEYTVFTNGILNLTPESWTQAYKTINKYFPGLEIIGLMQSQPGYGIYLNEKYIKLFKNNFNKPNQVFFVVDPVEKLNLFNIFNADRENLLGLSGYFIYYDKNDAMNSYLVDIKGFGKNKKDNDNNNEIIKSREKNAPTEILLRKKQFERVQKNNSENKKTINLMATLCGVLFLVCVIMGAGLVQNENRITKLEKNIASINFNNSDRASNVNKINNSTEKDNSNKEIEDKQVFLQTSPKIIKDIEQDNKNKDIYYDKELLSEEDNKKNKDNNPSKNKEEKRIEIPTNYIVKDGDSLSKISKEFYGNINMIEKILEENNMDNADKIYIGMILKMPNVVEVKR
ncbi:MAG: LysM peptidoglycan-binding domain-containing protein [Clostridiales bacterium]|jgi:LysM repeat protein|nr:LysM peptidoglycan-binding domain-containing protein [Clostridiales bacterium]